MFQTFIQNPAGVASASFFDRTDSIEEDVEGYLALNYVHMAIYYSTTFY